MKRQLSRTAYFRLGRVPVRIGAVLKGWDLTEDRFRNPDTLNVVDCRIMTAKCDHDCRHCYTDKQRSDLPLDLQLGIISQIAEMGAHAIDFLGEGEPTLDSHFLEVVEHTVALGVQPVIFTDAATKLRDTVLTRRLNDLGVTVVPKCDSLFNADYQNWVVRDETGTYFGQRNEAIDLLVEEGFNAVNDEGTTRLGFDMVVTTRNLGEIEQTLRYCRERNMWIVFCPFIPAGRTGEKGVGDEQIESLALSPDQRWFLAETVRRVDLEYGFDHPICSNFVTGVCVELVQIYGDGRVSTCPGNEVIVGNIRDTPLSELYRRIIELYPSHHCTTFDGNCPYRPPIVE